ncbi:YrhC family protein [Fredinandcohnia humi]
MDKQVKNLRSKITDYTNFAYVLLAISAFLYIGVIIPEERSSFQLFALMGSTIIFLGVAFGLLMLVLKYKKQIDEIER